MKRKLLTLLLLCGVLMLSVFGLVACGTTTYTVTFDANGGLPAPQSQTVNQGDKITLPEQPTLEDCTFEGWYFGEQVWDFENGTVTSDLTLTAKWKEICTEGLQFTDGENNTCVVSGYTGTSANVIIPSSYNGKSVTGISSEAFGFSTILQTIKIPASVISVGGRAFDHCTSLTTVTFKSESKLEIIGFSAFLSCEKLTTIVLPSSVTTIDEAAFQSCLLLQSISIPSNVTKIAKFAFSLCSALASITFEDTTTWSYTSNASYVGGTQIDVGSATDNATNLTKTYRNYNWYKV